MNNYRDILTKGRQYIIYFHKGRQIQYTFEVSTSNWFGLWFKYGGLGSIEKNGGG